MTLENAAKVRTLGQVELLVAFVTGALIHQEQHQAREYVAGVVVLIGIVVYASG